MPADRRWLELKNRLAWVFEILEEEGVHRDVMTGHDLPGSSSVYLRMTLHLPTSQGEIESETIERHHTQDDHGERVRKWARRVRRIIETGEET